MRHSYRLIALFSLFLALPAVLEAQAQVAAQEELNPALPNYLELTPRIGTGGQPDEAGMKQLAERGYKYVVNIRASGEKFDFAAEEKLMTSAGYVIPVAKCAPNCTYKDMTVGFIQTGSEGGWRAANTASFKETATKVGGNLKVYGAQDRLENQVSAFRNFIADPEVNVIVLAALETTGWEDVLKEAQAAGAATIAARCYEGEENLAYAPVIEALRSSSTFSFSDFVTRLTVERPTRSPTSACVISPMSRVEAPRT